ncbi:uncharacterized protein LOC132383230 isoform X1 [Hypanus sabinus]|uniref:uncharacterized protein LOC132383230 isoform X1 n=1 Tax=Hypanus sabinus TaxID=79690 RepID=UPI0028C42250|nr:uncharacterized protein LOC132383230 isoform X1 [Hypanus sabinus]
MRKNFFSQRVVNLWDSRMYFLRLLRKYGLPQELLLQFYTAVIESVLCTSITVWFGAATKQDRTRLQRTVRTAERIIGASLPSIVDLYSSRLKKRVGNVIKDSSHPAHGLFELLLSGREQQGRINLFAEASFGPLNTALVEPHNRARQSFKAHSGLPVPCRRCTGALHTQSASQSHFCPSPGPSPFLQEIQDGIGPSGPTSHSNQQPKRKTIYSVHLIIVFGLWKKTGAPGGNPPPSPDTRDENLKLFTDTAEIELRTPEFKVQAVITGVPTPSDHSPVNLGRDRKEHQIFWCSPGRESHLVPQHQLHSKESPAASLLSVKAEESPSPSPHPHHILQGLY